MEKLDLKLNRTNSSGLFHNTRSDVGTLARSINILVNKINELVEEINELKKK